MATETDTLSTAQETPAAVEGETPAPDSPSFAEGLAGLPGQEAPEDEEATPTVPESEADSEPGEDESPSSDEESDTEDRDWIRILAESPERITEVPIDELEGLREDNRWERLPRKVRDEAYEALLVKYEVELEDAREEKPSGEVPEDTIRQVQNYALNIGTQRAMGFFKGLVSASREYQRLDGELEQKFGGDVRRFRSEDPDGYRKYRDLETQVEQGESAIERTWVPTAADLVDAEWRLLSEFPDVQQRVAKSLQEKPLQGTWDDWYRVRSLAMQELSASTQKNGSEAGEKKSQADRIAERRRKRAEKLRGLPKPEASNGSGGGRLTSEQFAAMSQDEQAQAWVDRPDEVRRLK